MGLDHILEQFLSKDQIEHTCVKLAENINEDYYSIVNDEDPLVVIGILKGCIIFVSDIIRKLGIPVITDFVKLSSYGKNTFSSGTVSIIQDISLDIKNKHVLVIDEVIDSGHTLAFYLERLRSSNPSSIKLCTLLDKEECRSEKINIKTDYRGIKTGKQFLVGYGLDYNELYRNLPDIYKLSFKQ